MTAEEIYTVEVMLNGHAHQVVVAGNSSPAFGFEPAGTVRSEPVMLRLRCDTCGGIGKLQFVPPSKSWRRPYVVRRVVHEPK